MIYTGVESHKDIENEREYTLALLKLLIVLYYIPFKFYLYFSYIFNFLFVLTWCILVGCSC